MEDEDSDSSDDEDDVDDDDIADGILVGTSQPRLHKPVTCVTKVLSHLSVLVLTTDANFLLSCMRLWWTSSNLMSGVHICAV